MADLYEGADAIFYDAYSTGLPGDIQFYLEEARRAGSPVLEAGCGTGRILIPVAEAGIDIVGLDRSSAMLDMARQKVSQLPEETKRRISLVEGDMRNFSLGQTFNLVMIPYRGFLHLLAPEDQRLALGCIRGHLKEGGLLVFNIFDPRVDIIAAHLGPLGGAAKKDLEFAHPGTGHRVVVWETQQYDLERQLMEEDLIYDELNEEDAVVNRTYGRLTIRFAYRYEIQHLLELCGFQIEALYGDFERGPFHYGGEQVWLARRA